MEIKLFLRIFFIQIIIVRVQDAKDVLADNTTSTDSGTLKYIPEKYRKCQWIDLDECHLKCSNALSTDLGEILEYYTDEVYNFMVSRRNNLSRHKTF